MKKFVILTIASALLFTIGCTNDNENPVETPVDTPVETPVDNPVERDEPKRITMQIEAFEYDEANNSILYSIKNTDESNLEYGAPYVIQMETEENVWEDTEHTKNMAFDMMLRTVEPQQAVVESFDVSPFSGTPGRYRIVRQYGTEEESFTITAYFVVTEMGTYENLTLDIQ